MDKRNNMYTHTLADIPTRQLFEGYTARMIHTDSMTIVYWTVKAGYSIPEHHHVHEQISHISEGEFELVIDGTPQRLVPGVTAVIPSNVKHYGKAITDCQLIDIFCPVREEYR